MRIISGLPVNAAIWRLDIPILFVARTSAPSFRSSSSCRVLPSLIVVKKSARSCAVAEASPMARTARQKEAEVHSTAKGAGTSLSFPALERSRFEVGAARTWWDAGLQIVPHVRSIGRWGVRCKNRWGGQGCEVLTGRGRSFVSGKTEMGGIGRMRRMARGAISHWRSEIPRLTPFPRWERARSD